MLLHCSISVTGVDTTSTGFAILFWTVTECRPRSSGKLLGCGKGGDHNDRQTGRQTNRETERRAGSETWTTAACDRFFDAPAGRRKWPTAARHDDLRSAGCDDVVWWGRGIDGVRRLTRTLWNVTYIGRHVTYIASSVRVGVELAEPWGVGHRQTRTTSRFTELRHRVNVFQSQLRECWTTHRHTHTHTRIHTYIYTYYSTVALVLPISTVVSGVV